MGKIIKYNVQAILKNTSFYMQFIVLNVLITFTLFSLLKDMPPETPRFIIYRILLIMGLSILAFITNIALSETVIREKSTGRVEFLLSNGFKAGSYWYGSILSTWITTEFVIILTFLTSYFFNVLVFPQVITFTGTLKVFVALSIFNLGLSGIICSLVLKIRKMSVVNNLLWIAGFLLIFGGSYIVQKIPLNPKYDAVILTGLSLCGIGFFLAGILLGRKIDSETIVLTIPD